MSTQSATTTQLKHFLPVITLVCIIPLWEIICRAFSIPDYLLPSPSAIFDAFFKVDMGRWMEHLWATLRVSILGFGLSLLISFPLAISMVYSRYMTKTLYPLLIIIQSTPVVAVAPLIIVMFGTGDAPRLAITCLITFFPLVVAMTTGMLETPSELIELSRSLGVRRHKEIFQIRLPNATPHIFSGMKVAITLALIGAVVAEFVAAEKGLGYFIQFSTSYFKVPQAFSALIFLSAVSLSLFKLIQWVQKRFYTWSVPKDPAS